MKRPDTEDKENEAETAGKRRSKWQSRGGKFKGTVCKTLPSGGQILNSRAHFLTPCLIFDGLLKDFSYFIGFTWGVIINEMLTLYYYTYISIDLRFIAPKGCWPTFALR